MTRRLFNHLFPLSWLAPACFAAGDARQLFQEVTRRYQGLKSYYFEGKTVAQSIFNGKTTETETGFTVALEAPAKFRLEFRYPTAGNWLRVSDGTSFLESRSITKESKVTPVKGREINALRASPLHNFERLSQTAVNPMIMRVEFIEVDGKKLECDFVQFEAGRRQLRKDEWPGPSMVWVSRSDRLVMREEIRTSAKTGENLTETRRTTFIEHFSVDQPLAAELFHVKA
ncbi:MAG: hypothetical protein ABL995_17210 [Bryobacteraceae bacterium]